MEHVAGMGENKEKEASCQHDFPLELLLFYLWFPIVESVVKFRVDFVMVVVFAVGSEPNQTEAHERRD